jgi:hypothetical protein
MLDTGYGPDESPVSIPVSCEGSRETSTEEAEATEAEAASPAEDGTDTSAA